MKIVSIVGARPQFIKAAVVSRALRERGGITEVMVHTGQHYDDKMSDIFFRQLKIPEPRYNLEIGSSSHAEQTGTALIRLEPVLIDEAPDVVLLYGDTNSTLAGALAAAKLKLPIVHVEAGVRAFNPDSPEEVNRKLSDHLSTLLFVPSESAVTHLLNEGIAREKIHNVGDVMLDAARYYLEQGDGDAVLKSFGVANKGYILATVHRPWNTDDPQRLRVILEALSTLGESTTVLFPAHPRTRKAMTQIPGNPTWSEGLRLIDPVGYTESLHLQQGARVVITDSGGMQKESFFGGVPCVTLNGKTAWTELVELGWNELVEANTVTDVLGPVERALQRTDAPGSQPYGQGDAGVRIADILATHFST